MKKAASLFILLVAVSCLSGCGHRARWLSGQWRFDEETTRQNLRAEQQAAAKESTGFSAIGAAAKQLAKGIISPALIAELDGSQITVTDKDFIMTSKDGNGQAFAYEVLSVPDPNTLTVKLSNGDVDTFHHEGTRFWMQSSGKIKIPIYFERVAK